MQDVAGRLAAFVAAEREMIAGLRLVAVGWATVELDRAAVELASALDLPAGAFVPAEAEVALGARCLVAVDAVVLESHGSPTAPASAAQPALPASASSPVPELAVRPASPGVLGPPASPAPDAPDAPAMPSSPATSAGQLAVVLLEPSTEGRLAATLARHGEGPAAVWFAGEDVSATITALQAGQVVLAAARDGPLGGARLLLDGPITGPHRFLVVGAPGNIAR